MALKPSGAAAAAEMQRLADTGATHPPLHPGDPIHNRCLETVQDVWGAPWSGFSAIDAWHRTPVAHRHTNPTLAPVGACHFWDVGANGHIALQAPKAGAALSTDAPKDNHVGEVALSWFAQNWGAKYLGWTDFLGGVVLPVGTKPVAKPVPNKPAPVIKVRVSLSHLRAAALSAGRAPEVLPIQRVLAARGLLAVKFVNGKFGPETRAAYAKWQRMCGYKGVDADGIPGAPTLVRLGFVVVA